MSLSEAAVRMTVAEAGIAEWDACNASGHPFTSADFLGALEDSGSVGGRTGWTPCHLALLDAAGATAAVMPLYVKSHSQGEYVFDHAWADAYIRAGGRYYPKLQAAVPFTPVTGPRFLVRPDIDQALAKQALASASRAFCDQIGASSVHVTFPLESEQALLAEDGWLPRQDLQYWWSNTGYGTFDDFLGDLSASRRKTIRRERREAQADVEILHVTGSDLCEEHWDAFWAFYQDTGARKWGRPYLTRAFFSLLGERMADRVLLILARREGRYIAGALNLIGPDALYGRWWGCLDDVPFLHFELCYYQAIEHAIRLELPRVEAGAQGEHKIARGYLPAPVYSAHWIADPRLRAPVAAYLDEERPAMAAEREALSEAYSPFRTTC